MTTPNLKAITTVTPKIMASLQCAVGDNAVYTVAANKAAKLTTMQLSNVSTSAVTVSVSFVPSGGAIDATHRIVSGFVLTAGDSLSLSDVRGTWLGDGDRIVVTASAATAIDVTISGLEMS